jgi:hypothetical protein
VYPINNLPQGLSSRTPAGGWPEIDGLPEFIKLFQQGGVSNKKTSRRVTARGPELTTKVFLNCHDLQVVDHEEPSPRASGF